MSDNDFQRLLARLEDAPDPGQNRQTRLLSGILVGLIILLVVIPVAMKLLFDPASGLVDIALGGSPLDSLWGSR